MPSSDPTMIPKVLAVVMHIKPMSILDVGVGNGRYGFLFRECLDWNFGRIKRESWEILIDGIEVDESYVNLAGEFVYDNIILRDWMDVSLIVKYDIVFIRLERYMNFLTTRRVLYSIREQIVDYCSDLVWVSIDRGLIYFYIKSEIV